LKFNDLTENNDDDDMKIVLINRQDTQNPMLVLLLIISCYIITFTSNKDDVQNTSRIQDDMSEYSAYMSAVANSNNIACVSAL
jgi:uncharacterized membrane protein (DUF106 family)